MKLALEKKILLEHVRDQHLLLARLESVEVRVGVFFPLVEIDEVVLPEVVVPVAEDARAEICIGIDEAAEIRDERLDAPP